MGDRRIAARTQEAAQSTFRKRPDPAAEIKSGALLIEARRVGRDTMLSQIVANFVADAQRSPRAESSGWRIGSPAGFVRT